MKIVRKTIRKITYVSAAAGIIFLVASILIFLTDPTLDYMIIAAFTIAVVPPGIASILHGRWKGKIEKALPEFLRDLATSFRTGMPLQVALEHASNRKYGPLTLELKAMVAHMSWGMNFNNALTEFSERIDLPVVKKATVLILEAGKHHIPSNCRCHWIITGFGTKGCGIAAQFPFHGQSGSFLSMPFDILFQFLNDEFLVIDDSFDDIPD